MNCFRGRKLLMAVLLLCFLPMLQGGGLFRQTDLFVAGEGGVHTYRIPSLITTQKGTLLAFCEARKKSSSDQTPTDLVLKRSFDQGTTWEEARIVLGGRGGEAIMNPTPVIDRRDGSILLFCNPHPNMHVQYKPGAVRVLLLKSDNDGATWSDPIDLTDQVTDKKVWEAALEVGPGVAIQLANGRLLVPLWYFRPGMEGDFLNSVIFSDDGGQTWRRGERVEGFGSENQLVELADGSVMMSIRADSGGGCGKQHHYRKVALSRDGGLTWPRAFLDKALITPCCQGSILRHSKKREGGGDRNRLLFSNPAHASRRINMSVLLSYDEGETWPVSRTVYAGPSAYSCLTVLSDGTIGLVFEMGESGPYEKIRFARMNLEWLTEGKVPE